MLNVPPIIHYVWLKNRFRSARVNTLLTWARLNDQHEHTLWVRRSHQQSIIEEILRQLEYDKREEGEVRGKGSNQLEIVVSDVMYFLYKIKIRAVEDLSPLTSVDPLHNEYYSWHGMPEMVEVAGLWAVYDYGGMYIDFSAHPVHTLPMEIVSQKGILLSTLDMPQQSFATALVGAPKESEKVRSLCKVLAIQTHEGHPLSPTKLPQSKSSAPVVPSAATPLLQNISPSSSPPAMQSRLSAFGRLKNKLGRRSPSPSTNLSVFEESMEVVRDFDSNVATIPYGAEPTSTELVQKWFVEVEMQNDPAALKTDYEFQKQTGATIIIDHSDPRYQITNPGEDSIAQSIGGKANG